MAPVLAGIADLHGPQFLLLYAAVIAVTLLGAWAFRVWSDPTRGMPLPAVPAEPDPCRIAWLRGGPNELTRLLVFDLHRRGYLKLTARNRWFSTEKAVQQAADGPDPRELSPMERAAYDWLSTPRTASEIFRGIPRRLEHFCDDYESEYAGEQLVRTSGMRSAALVAGLCGAALIVGLGGYKLSAALAKGKSNVGFLFLFGIVGIALLLAACRTPRLTDRGRRFVERLQAAFFRLRVDPPGSGDPGSERDGTLLLTMAVFGIGALAGTEYAHLSELFPRGAEQASGGANTWAGSAAGCGAGCGAGGGGGGCGGGCGGCGGCGG